MESACFGYFLATRRPVAVFTTADTDDAVSTEVPSLAPSLVPTSITLYVALKLSAWLQTTNRSSYRSFLTMKILA